MFTSSGRSHHPDTVRRLSAPSPLRVEADAYRTPRRVYRRGIWRVVMHVRERWRIEDRWWTDEPISREYFELLLEDGRPLTVYVDRLSGCWQSHSRK